ncbi:MAG: hypothetical protein Q9227_004408 [Pyrenula ochraceoflavens]
MVNAITEEFLGQLKAEVNKELGEEDNIVQIGNDNTASALYQVSLSCRFIADTSSVSEEQSWSFHVFRNLVEGVTLILGQSFLHANEIMTTRSHLLKEFDSKALSSPKCMSMGPVTRSGLRMKIYINTKPVMALPDTGSELDLISRACAEEMQLKILPLGIGDTKMVEFADGTLGELTGKTIVQFDTHKAPKRSVPGKQLMPYSGRHDASQSTGGYGHTVKFYILDNLRHNVTLSQQLLYALDAFNQHSSAMQILDIGNSLQTIFEHGEKITELMYDLKQIWKNNLRKRHVQENELREQLTSARDRSEQEEVERKLNDLERLRRDEAGEYEDALREMERKRHRT